MAKAIVPTLKNVKHLDVTWSLNRFLVINKILSPNQRFKMISLLNDWAAAILLSYNFLEEAGRFKMVHNYDKPLAICYWAAVLAISFKHSGDSNNE